MCNDSSPATDFLRSKIESLRINQITHYTVCERHRNRHKVLGVLLVILSTVSLTFTFFDPSSKYPYVEYLPAVISILVAVISAVLAFVNDNAQAIDHQSSAVEYGALLRECEARASGAFLEEDNRNFLAEFMIRWRSVSVTSPLTRLVDRNKINSQN